MTTEEELQIIKQVIDGDKNAFEALVLANQRNVYNLAMKMTGNEEDAQDIAQDTFLKAFRQLSGFRGDCHFSVWLYRLTHNLCIDFLRKRQRSKESPLTYTDEDGDCAELQIPDLRSLPERDTLRRELGDTLDQSILELPEQHREIFLMREVSGFSYSEIADTLGISEGTVKSRLSRARQNLVNILVKKGTFPPGFSS